MKNKYFGNILDENLGDKIRNVGNSTEFYKASDKFSARTLNRPIRANYEDLENIYETLQNICKTLYGQKENGILPDVYEEMNPNTLTEGHFFDKEETFIRVPTGAFFAKLDDEQAKYYKTSYEESNQYSRDFYIDNDRNAAIIFNRPNIELFERQLAEHFNIDLNDQDENIRLYCESYTDSVVETNPSTENEQYIDLKNKCSRAQNIKYYLYFDTTKYNYATKLNSKETIITSEVNSGRIPINTKNYCFNVFDIVEQVYNTYGNYLTQEDNEFGLEELIPVNNAWTEGKYIIFFNPNTKEAKNNDFVNYSDSGRFGIVASKNINNVFGQNESYKIIKLYEVYLSFEYDAAVKRCVVDKNSIVCFLSKIDRTTLDIKNINLTNALNSLVIERVKLNDSNGNINIGEAHIDEEELGERNISIGLRNLGYSEVDNKDKDPTLDSQRYKTNIGYDNISIGTNAMKRTSNINGKMAEKNIAIGSNTLINIGTGKKNIEIGSGNGYIKSQEGNINIGDNLTAYDDKNIALGNYNIILGDKNAYKAFQLNDKNIIIGNENNNDNDNDELIINNENIIVGKNKLKEIGSKNIIIGNNDSSLDSGNNNTIIGLNNTAGKRNNDNYVIGSNNCDGILGDDNVVIGHKNIGEKSNTEETTNNYIFGIENDSNASNSFILGASNNIESTNNYTFGKENNITSKDNFSVGTANVISSNNNKLYGAKNNITSNDNIVIGDNNIVSKDNNKIFGNDNTSTGNFNFIISNGKKVNNSNSIAIGCSNENKVGNFDDDNQVIIGPIIGTTYRENGLTNDTDKISASTIKIDGKKGSIKQYFKTAEFIGNTTTFEGNVVVETGSLIANRYISQSLNGKDMYVNTFDEHTTGIPVAGSLYTDIYSNTPKDSITEYKTFVGSLTSNDKSKTYDFVSIRENNGKGDKYETAATQGSIIFVDRNSGRLYSSVQNNNKWDNDRQYIDSTGNQSIDNTIQFSDGLTVPEKEKTDNINTTIANGLEIRGNVVIKQKNNKTDKDYNSFIIENPTTINKKNFSITGTKSRALNVLKSNEITEINTYNLINIDSKEETVNIAANYISAFLNTGINIKSNGSLNEVYDEKISIVANDEAKINCSNGNTIITAKNSAKLTNNENQNTAVEVSNANIAVKAATIDIGNDETTNLNIKGNLSKIEANTSVTINANSQVTTFGGVINNTKYAFIASSGIKVNGDTEATTFTAVSARKYKKNIVPTIHKAVDEINKIGIVDFNFKTDENNESPRIGFIADDTDEIFSTKSKDKMDIYNCIGMLLKAVQELSTENKELKNRISKLENK